MTAPRATGPVPAPTPAPVVASVPSPSSPTTAATTDTGTPGSAYGLLPDGAGLVARLGTGLRLGAEYLTGKEVPLSDLPQPLPGVRFTGARWNPEERTLRLDGTLAVPHTDGAPVSVSVDRQGRSTIRGSVSRRLALPALGNPVLTLALGEDGGLAGTAAVRGADLVPRPLRGRARVEGSADLALVGGRLAGGGSLEIAYEELGAATVTVGVSEEGKVTATGSVRLRPPLLDEVRADLVLDEAGNLTGNATVAVGALTTPVTGLTLHGGSVVLGYENGRPTGAITGLAATYAGLGSVLVSKAEIDGAGRLTGSGQFASEIPGLETASGALGVRDGALSGRVALTPAAFPKGLPVRRPTIVAEYDRGVLAVSGSADVDLGPAGKGRFSAAWSEDGAFSFGADVTLTLPGLQPTSVRIDYADGAITGEAQVPVDAAFLPGLAGSVTVRYAEDRWSGENTLSYAADDGKLSGSITVTVTQTERDTLEIGGSGAVTAQIAPRLRGTLTAVILPEGAVDISGVIEVTEPLELFGEKRDDRELVNISQNIPLWALLVAVIRIRAGVRAGIGPGVFRNIKVEGSYTAGGAEGDPSLGISGELYVPAFVEGYVSLGAGLGLDVKLGELTGGIEAVGRAGVYGAAAVEPRLTYEDGDWGIEGTLTLAGGARLTLGLNAWAEVEALWVTVWEDEWKLVEHVMPIGPDLALQARMNYRFGRPQPPEIEFTSSDIDTEALIQGAMPEDGPAASGAREALANKAEWKGALKAQKHAPVPPEAAARAQASETPPEPATKKPARSGPPGPGAGAPTPAEPGTTPPSEPTRSAAVDRAAAPDSSVPPAAPPDQVPTAGRSRYAKPITLATLDEPPAPVPRTAEQEREDVDAAATAVDLASAAASDTDRLDNYFPKIKNRFRLTKLGYEGDFERGFAVVGSINPSFEKKLDEPLTGTGLPTDLQKGTITKIEYTTGDLYGRGEVGMRMEAAPLGPDHRQGSGPSGQDALMALLPVNPSIYRATDQRYVRGHLLNDNLGGPGEPKNLFPITAQANARHHAAIEGSVKKWVNEDRYWVDYTVAMVNVGGLKDLGNGKSSIDATIDAEVSVLDTGLQSVPALTRRVTIASTYEVGDADTVALLREEDEAELAMRKAEGTLAVDTTGTPVLLSSRHGSTTPRFPGVMYADIAASVGREGGSIQATAAKLTKARGFGDRSEQVLIKAWNQAVAGGGPAADLALDQDERGTFTRIVNLWDEALAGLL